MQDSDGTSRFDRVDWSEIPTAQRRVSVEHLTMLVGIGLLGSLYAYDRATGGYLVFDWYLQRVDWVFVAGCVVIVAYVGVPAVRNRDVTRRAFRHLLSRPSTAAATALLGAFVFLGLFGPPVIGSSELRLEHSFHPPYGATVPRAAVGNCLGDLTPVEGSIHQHCHGTLSAYPFGANGDGIAVDYLVADGARTALYVAVFTAAFVVPLAAAVGVVAGFRGGLMDDLLMAYVDVQLSIPAIIVYVIGYMYWNPSLLLLLVTFGLLSWGGIARLVR
ncbi:ABC transporter permease, partial [Halovivax sp.]|uniref:ABC transporter permease n=1 Tax=Halovivax sp. TaxID=1935978 RepID=UPI0025C71248